MEGVILKTRSRNLLWGNSEWKALIGNREKRDTRSSPSVILALGSQSPADLSTGGQHDLQRVLGQPGPYRKTLFKGKKKYCSGLNENGWLRLNEEVLVLRSNNLGNIHFFYLSHHSYTYEYLLVYNKNSSWL